jgi:hypothetical protein
MITSVEKTKFEKGFAACADEVVFLCLDGAFTSYYNVL